MTQIKPLRFLSTSATKKVWHTNLISLGLRGIIRFYTFLINSEPKWSKTNFFNLSVDNKMY